MKIDIMTLFPELIDGVMQQSIIGRAQAKGFIQIHAVNIRDYALDKHHKADDSPYGGGRGMVMLPEPLYLCHAALTDGAHIHTVMMSAQGAPFTQAKARELLAREHIILVCGHYEGVDQRFIECAGWCLACCRMKLLSSRKATGMACWSIHSIPILPSGAGVMCPRYCYPGTMRILPVGGVKCHSNAPGVTVRIYLRHFSRRISRIRKSLPNWTPNPKSISEQMPL